MENNENNDFSKINWLQQLAYDYLKQQKRHRRWRMLARLVVIALIVLVVIAGPPDKSDSKKNLNHIAVGELKGGIFD